MCSALWVATGRLAMCVVLFSAELGWLSVHSCIWCLRIVCCNVAVVRSTVGSQPVIMPSQLRDGGNTRQSSIRARHSLDAMHVLRRSARSLQQALPPCASWGAADGWCATTAAFWELLPRQQGHDAQLATLVHPQGSGHRGYAQVIAQRSSMSFAQSAAP
jgi:hypothetical protein